MFGAFLLKSIFQNDLTDLDSLVIYQSYIALCEIRFRSVIGVRTVVARTQFVPAPKGGLRGESSGGLQSLALKTMLNQSGSSWDPSQYSH